MNKIILVDDHKIFRDSIKSLITIEEIAEIIAEAGNGVEFLKLLKKHQPDLVLMDISMPQMDGVEATIEALKINPEIKILALSSFGDEEYYYKMINAGVKGFVLKNAGIEELELAINTVMDGDSYFSNELLRRIIANIGVKTKLPKSEELSDREIEVLQEICNGLTNNEIADKLNISAETVKGHRSKILAKTNSKNTASLVMYAIKNKMIEV
jgi:DNA-binding NarL/FixJ family response regulator